MALNLSSKIAISGSGHRSRRTDRKWQSSVSANCYNLTIVTCRSHFSLFTSPLWQMSKVILLVKIMLYPMACIIILGRGICQACGCKSRTLELQILERARLAEVCSANCKISPCVVWPCECARCCENMKWMFAQKDLQLRLGWKFNAGWGWCGVIMVINYSISHDAAPLLYQIIANFLPTFCRGDDHPVCSAVCTISLVCSGHCQELPFLNTFKSYKWFVVQIGIGE